MARLNALLDLVLLPFDEVFLPVLQEHLDHAFRLVSFWALLRLAQLALAVQKVLEDVLDLSLDLPLVL